MIARLITSLLLAAALSGCNRHSQGNNATALAAKQALVVERGRSIMPFDMNRTIHHFRKLPSGGIQEVLSTDRDPQQIALIRDHLRTEAGRFQNGNFSDPSAIHGAQMPGLKSLKAGASRIDIRYQDIAGGAQISYQTSNPGLVAAIHRWFDSQVRQHGRHAMPM